MKVSSKLKITLAFGIALWSLRSDALVTVCNDHKAEIAVRLFYQLWSAESLWNNFSGQYLVPPAECRTLPSDQLRESLYTIFAEPRGSNEAAQVFGLWKSECSSVGTNAGQKACFFSKAPVTSARFRVTSSDQNKRFVVSRESGPLLQAAVPDTRLPAPAPGSAPVVAPVPNPKQVATPVAVSATHDSRRAAGIAAGSFGVFGLTPGQSRAEAMQAIKDIYGLNPVSWGRTILYAFEPTDNRARDKMYIVLRFYQGELPSQDRLASVEAQFSTSVSTVNAALARAMGNDAPLEFRVHQYPDPDTPSHQNTARFYCLSPSVSLYSVTYRSVFSITVSTSPTVFGWPGGCANARVAVPYKVLFVEPPTEEQNQQMAKKREEENIKWWENWRRGARDRAIHDYNACIDAANQHDGNYQDYYLEGCRSMRPR